MPSRNRAYMHILSQWIDLLGLGNLSALQQCVQRVPNKSSACHDSEKAAQAKSNANANTTFFSRPVISFVSFHWISVSAWKASKRSSKLEISRRVSLMTG